MRQCSYAAQRSENRRGQFWNCEKIIRSPAFAFIFVVADAVNMTQRRFPPSLFQTIVFVCRLLSGAAEPLGDQSTGDFHPNVRPPLLPELAGLLRPLHGSEALLPRLQRQPGGGAQRVLVQAAGEALPTCEQAIRPCRYIQLFFFFTRYQMTTERLMLHYGHRLYLLRGEMHEIKKVGRFSVHPKVKDRYLASYYVIIYSSGLFRCELQSSGGIGRVCRLPNIMELRMTLKTHF